MEVQVSGVSKSYLTLVTLEALMIVGAAVAVLVDASSGSNTDLNDLALYSVLSIFVSCCLLYFAFNAILTENKFQFAASLVTSTMLTAYLVYHYVYDTLGSPLFSDITLSLMIVSVSLQFLYFAMAYAVVDSFGWRMYKRVGSNVSLQELYTTYMRWLTLLKLDLEFGVILVTLSAFFLFDDTVTIVLNVVAMVVTLVWATLGVLVVKREHRKGMYTFFVWGLFEPVYIVYYLVIILTEPDEFPNVTPTQFIVVGSLALLVRVSLLIMSWRVFQNFDHGLRMRVFFKHLLHDQEDPFEERGEGGIAADPDMLMEEHMNRLGGGRTPSVDFDYGSVSSYGESVTQL